MTNRFRISSTLPRKAERVRSFAGRSAAAKRVLPMGLFNLEKILVSTEQFFALQPRNCRSQQRSRFGLKLGTEERIERYDPVKIAAISARSFRDAIERLSRYKQLTCPEEIRVVKRGNESLSSSSGFSRIDKETAVCWWTCVSRGSSLWRIGALAALCVPNGWSFNELQASRNVRKTHSRVQ